MALGWGRRGGGGAEPPEQSSAAASSPGNELWGYTALFGPDFGRGAPLCMRKPLVGSGMGIGARLRPAAAQGGVISPE